MMIMLTMFKMIMMMGKVTSMMSISETCKTMLMNTLNLKDISIITKMIKRMEKWLLMMGATTKSLKRVLQSSKINDDASDEKTLPTMIRCRSVCKRWE